MKKVITLIFTASTLFLTGCCTTHEHANAKWEYQQTDYFPTVQKLAAEGWTLVGFYGQGDKPEFFILKRRVQ